MSTTLLLSEATRARLGALFNAGAAKFDPLPCHWVACADEDSVDYCREHALKRIEEIKAESPDREPILDGGWPSDHDSTPYCQYEGCGALLDGALTSYGAEQEIDHFLDYGFDPASDDDCRAMAEVVSTLHWGQYAEADVRVKFETLLQRIAEMTNA